MAKTSYITANGMMLGEVTNGVMRNYGTDALGSVVSTYSNGTLENTYAYKPYGGLLAKTGVASDPSFLWNGGSGYRAMTSPSANFYVRARHYNSLTATWNSVDRYWPQESPYGYVKGMVANINDPTGKSGLTVSAVRTSEWSANNFGTYKSYTLWGGFGKDGWIIQFNTLVSTYWPCGFIGPPFTSTTTFYEAWMVLDSEVYAPCTKPMENMSAIKPLPWTDSWNSGGQPGVPNLITETITSNAVFVAAETPEDPPTKDFFQYFSCGNPISKIIAGSKLNAVWPSAGTLNWQNGIQTLNYKANCCIKNPGLPTFQRTPSGSATLLKGCR